ncbi:aftiphilin isoform X2 [Astyanax mexicanus]|uniref:aftiphilin isoform X2 n=1 Tax=Astyanax mexicanus TaxID=7994 RepID=UPI0020CB07BA|nr:aftiphilin isoform X2 [Astyanax mexicanus]
MEPDVVRLYSSSPPPLDEGGEEEDEDEFGDFGGYCSGVSSSFSLSEFDTPTSANQSHATETSPPDLYITSVQNASSSGKNVTSEEAETLTENLQASFSIPNPLVNETSVSIAYCENRKPEGSEIVINGAPPSDLKGAPCVVPNTAQHRSASNPQPEAGSAAQQSDLSVGSGGHSVSNGQSKLNTGMALDGSTVTSLTNSTETGVGSRAESSSGPVSPSAAFQISLEKVSESEENVVDEVSMEFQDIPFNNTSGDQSIDEGRTEQQQEQEEVSTSFQEPSGQESVASFGEAVPESGSEDLGDWTETSVGPAAEADEVSGAQLCKDSLDHNMVPCMEVREDFEEVCGTTTDFTLKVVPDAEGDKVSEELKGTTEMDESFGDFRDAVGVVDFSRTESATQEGFADFVTAVSGCSTDDDYGDTDTLKDWKEEEELPEEDQEAANDRNIEETWCSELPPSDSFADFSSAPFDGSAGSRDGWVAFGMQEESESQRESWSAFGEEQPSSTAVATSGDNLQNDNVSIGTNCKLQNLFQSSFFPSEVTSEIKEVVPLQALLDPQDNPESSSHPVQGEAAAMWRHLLDTHSAHGLKVQWVGSRSNRILLDCLGIRNILFTGQKKRPLIVPMFASGLGMLEPTKDPVRPSPTSPAPQTPYSPGQDRSTLCTLVASSLSSREDAGGVGSQLNLDFFGPVDDSSSDSDTDAPVLPGVDPELYVLTTAKLDSSNVGSNVAEAFNKLMETVEKTSTVTRKTEKMEDGAISEEAARVISLLPDMSFMRARVLMFPYSLNPAANCP